jgi:hypothetical protein
MAVNRYIVLGTTENLASWESRIFTDESAAIVVDDEAGLDAALAQRDLLDNGREIYLRGEGTGGIIECTAPKTITANHTTIRGNALLNFTAPGDARGITINADDVTLQDFEMTSNLDLATSVELRYGIVIADNTTKGNRLRLKNLEVHHWNRCFSKDGGAGTVPTEDVEVSDCYFHTFRGNGWHTCFGMTRMRARRTRVLGRIGSESHATVNGVTFSANVRDCSFENCEFGNVDRMGIECSVQSFDTGPPPTINLRSAVRNCYVHDCKNFGISLGHAHEAVIEGNWVRDVVGIGIEFSAQVVEPTSGIVRNNTVDGMTAGVGFSIDKVIDTLVYGNTIKNVGTVTPAGSRGISLYECQRCQVFGNRFQDTGDWQLLVHRGVGPNTGGFHLIEGNAFYNTVGLANGLAIYVFDINATCRNNVSYQKAGTELKFEANCNAGAGVVASNSEVKFLAGWFGGPEATGALTGSTAQGKPPDPTPSKASPVTIHSVPGIIEMHPASLADATTVTFLVNCNKAEVGDSCTVSHTSGGTLGGYLVWAHSFAAGSFKISVRNISGGALAEAIVLSYALTNKSPTNRVVTVP